MRKIWLIILLFLFSCEDDAILPTQNNDDSETTLRTMQQNEMSIGDLPQPMIVGGEEVDPACPNCKYPFMVSLSEGNGGHF